MDDPETVALVPSGPFAGVEDRQLQGSVGQRRLDDVEHELLVELGIRRPAPDLRVELALPVRKETDPAVGIDGRTSGTRRNQQVLRTDDADGQKRQVRLVAEREIDGAAVLLLDAAKLLLAYQRLWWWWRWWSGVGGHKKHTYTHRRIESAGDI